MKFKRFLPQTRTERLVAIILSALAVAVIINTLTNGRFSQQIGFVVFILVLCGALSSYVITYRKTSKTS